LGAPGLNATTVILDAKCKHSLFSFVSKPLRSDDGRGRQAIIKKLSPTPLQAMSEEQLKAFLMSVKSDAALQQKLTAAADAEAVIAIAKEAGFTVSIEELKRAEAEVSEEELETNAGAGRSSITQVCCIEF